MKIVWALFIIGSTASAMLPDSLLQKIAQECIGSVQQLDERAVLHNWLQDDASIIQKVDDVDKHIQLLMQLHIFNQFVRQQRKKIEPHQELLHVYYNCLNTIVAYVRFKQLGCTYQDTLADEASAWNLSYVDKKTFAAHLQEKFPQSQHEWPLIVPEFKKFFMVLQQQLAH